MSSPTASENPLLQRMRNQLTWPAWSEWSSNATPPAAADPDAHAAAAARLSRAGNDCRLVDDGGPWLSVFDAETLVERGSVQNGPLAGKGFAVKCLVAMAGEITTAGSAVRADAPAEKHDAPFVTRLNMAGAVALGTVTMHEFAFGVTGVNEWGGTAPNPAAPGRVPGGSSSGSASAVADGSADFAIGTDTGGSVRIPSAFCGIAGFKPAFGTYSTDGVFPLSITLDHVGLHAPTMADITELYVALGGPAHVAALDTLRIGVARSVVAEADDDVRQPVEQALDRLAAAGATLVDVILPDPEATFVASTTIMFSEAAAIHAEGLAAHRDRYGADIKARLELGAALSGTEVAAAHRLRQMVTTDVLGTLADVDVIASPTVPIVAPPIADAADPALPGRIVANTRLGNVVGLPAVTLPAPTTGLPVGLQLLGTANAQTLAVATAIENALTT